MDRPGQTATKKPFFSLIIPVFNGAHLMKALSETLRSLVFESFYEVVIVDDGSTDSTYDAASEFVAPLPNADVKILRKQNEGQFIARSYGVKESSGEYCLFLDADDSYVPDAFSVIKKELEDRNFPDVLCFSYFDVSHCGDRKNNSIGPCDNKKDYLLGLCNFEQVNSICTKAIKRHIAQIDVMPDKINTVRHAEDLLYSALVLEKCSSIFAINKPLYLYQDNLFSVTHSINLSIFSSYEVVFPLFLKSVRKTISDIEDNGYLITRAYAYCLHMVAGYIKAILVCGLQEEMKSKLVAYVKESPLLRSLSKGKKAIPLKDKVLFASLNVFSPQVFVKLFSRKGSNG